MNRTVEQHAARSRTRMMFLLATVLACAPPFASPARACDTWVALADATESGAVMLGKNSDRTMFDCQPLLLHPRSTWPAGATVTLGRITIPQVAETYATLGSSPYWCWGYEEGINEYGVAIGNEGVFTKALLEEVEAHTRGQGPDLGPTGMDLLRLGLERGKTAREALDVIARLIEQYGQFGSGLPTQGVAGAYHNSYIIADPREAWVLETVGTRWIARRLERGTTSISNTLQITTEWDLASGDVVDYAVAKGWWPKEDVGSFNFAEAYLPGEPALVASAARARVRAACSGGLLREQQGKITPRWMKRIARDRSTTPSIDLPVTASSCVAVLPTKAGSLPVLWWCPAVPSASCYVPFFVHSHELPAVVSTAGTFGRKIQPPSQVSKDEFSKASYWWVFRDLANQTAVARKTRGPLVRSAFDALEKDSAASLPDVARQAAGLREAGRNAEAAALLDGYTTTCVERAMRQANELRARFAAEPPAEVPDAYKPYVGQYLANFGPFQNTEFSVLVRDDRLALDVPGQMVFELKDPSEQGRWHFALTNDIAVSFDRDDAGAVVGMKMYQAGMTFNLPRVQAK